MSDISKAEANVAKAIAKNKKTKYFVEAGNDSTPTRQGPYYNAGKAKAAKKLATKAWRNVGKSGKKPELTGSPPGWTSTPGMTTETYRVSPRTGKMSNKRTLSADPRKQL